MTISDITEPRTLALEQFFALSRRPERAARSLDQLPQDLRELILLFVQDIENSGRFSESYLRSLALQPVRFLRWLHGEEIEPGNIEPAVLHQFRVWLTTTPARHRQGALRKPGTVYRAMERIRVFCGWLVDAGYLERDPFAGCRDDCRLRHAHVASFHMKRPQDQLITPPTMADFQAFFTAAKTVGATPLDRARDYALSLLLLDTGLRINVEALAMTRPDVEGPDGLRDQFVVRGKGGRHRAIPLNPGPQRAIADYLALRADVLPSLWVMQGWGHGHFDEFFPLEDTRTRRAFRAIAEAAGLDPVLMRPHNFRRGFAVESLSAGADLWTVAAIGGWRQTKTMERYARLGLERDALQRIRRYSVADRIDGAGVA